MTRKSILNITSVKKQSARIPANFPQGSSQVTWGGASISAGRISLFCPTGMYQTAVSNDYNRNTGTCFIRGYRENIRINVSNGGPWFHRRIVFSYKGNIYGDDDEFGPDSNTVYYDNAPGGVPQKIYGRVINDVNGDALGLLHSLLYKGARAVDWLDFRNAPVDTKRVSLISDRVRMYKAGHDEGHAHPYKTWLSFNKNLVYDDDSVGDAVSASAYSTSAKPGMGDVYIYDAFFPESQNAGTLFFNPEGTLYWHER